MGFLRRLFGREKIAPELIEEAYPPEECLPYDGEEYCKRAKKVIRVAQWCYHTPEGKQTIDELARVWNRDDRFAIPIGGGYAHLAYCSDITNVLKEIGKWDEIDHGGFLSIARFYKSILGI